MVASGAWFRRLAYFCMTDECVFVKLAVTLSNLSNEKTSGVRVALLEDALITIYFTNFLRIKLSWLASKSLTASLLRNVLQGESVYSMSRLKASAVEYKLTLLFPYPFMMLKWRLKFLESSVKIRTLRVDAKLPIRSHIFSTVLINNALTVLAY